MMCKPRDSRVDVAVWRVLLPHRVILGPGEDLVDKMEDIYGVWDEREGAPLLAKRLAMQLP